MSISIEAIINVILSILTIVGGFVGYYYKTKADIAKAADAAVNSVETPEMKGLGEEKFNKAVDQIYALVPLFLKIFIKRKYVVETVGFAFEQIEEYAKKQSEKKK